MNDSVVPLSDMAKLTQLQYKKKPILMEFYTEWCPPCKNAHSVLEREIKQSGGKFVVAYINSDQAEQLNIEYEIQGVPTIISINNKNQPVDSMIFVINSEVVGYDPKKIKELVDKVIKKETKK